MAEKIRYNPLNLFNPRSIFFLTGTTSKNHPHATYLQNFTA